MERVSCPELRTASNKTNAALNRRAISVSFMLYKLHNEIQARLYRRHKVSCGV